MTDHKPSKQMTIAAALSNMQKHREDYLAPGNTSIRSAAEQSAAQDEKLQLARARAPKPAKPGPKRAEQPIDLTGTHPQPGKLAQKRKAIEVASAKAATIFKKKKNNKWSEEDKLVATRALTFLKGHRANALKHLKNLPEYGKRFKLLKESNLRSWEKLATTAGPSSSGKQRGKPRVLSGQTI